MRVPADSLHDNELVLSTQLVQPASYHERVRAKLIEFTLQWQFVTLNERSATHQHFCDICDILGQKKPAEADPTGDFFTFEKGVIKTGGGTGFADVWYRKHFAWEYKGKKKNLTDAYRQLLNYREDLENPPLLVVCDLDRFEIHTNFTDTAKKIYAFDLADLVRGKPTATCPMAPIEVLRALFEDPNRLQPGETRAMITEGAAIEFARLSSALLSRNVPASDAARYLIRLMFCLFAEDTGLLPEKLFTKLIKQTRHHPERFAERTAELFSKMATGGWFGADEIKRFNGGLFEEVQVFPLSGPDLAILEAVAHKDWKDIDPSILGTLFERCLDPVKRAQLGAHYTSKADILAIVEPVLMVPLKREWAACRREADQLAEQRTGLMRTGTGFAPTAADHKAARAIGQKIEKIILAFCKRLKDVSVLDPACGSGNFLYVALRELLDLEQSVIHYGVSLGMNSFPTGVGPEQMHGLEISELAHELATVTIQIGYLQWLRDNGYGADSEPILSKLELVQLGDALIRFADDGAVQEPEWPQAEFIIGNPPFLGNKKMRSELGGDYVQALRTLYGGRVPGGADLVTYWFERARSCITGRPSTRAGLLTTNSIRFGDNRAVLDRIKDTGDIFMAYSDRPWVLDGASVRVSIVGFDGGQAQERYLDGNVVPSINSDLSGRATDVSKAATLAENQGIVFLGMMKAGAFDIDSALANRMCSAPINPNGCLNTDVVRRRLGGQDVTGRPRDGWIIDFGVDRTEEEASLYELPFEYVRKHVKPVRDENRRDSMRKRWWLHGEPRRGLRMAISCLTRCIVTPEVAKHRIFAWMSTDTVPDHKLHVFARDDDYFLGVLQSRVHEIWSLALCSWMGAGNDPVYASSRVFGTFPMPWPTGQESKESDSVLEIAEAAKSLVSLRDAWLNPTNAGANDIKLRTLTNLYNKRPSWLDIAHRKLDAAVIAAYRWPKDIDNEQILEKLLLLNLERSKDLSVPGKKFEEGLHDAVK